MKYLLLLLLAAIGLQADAQTNSQPKTQRDTISTDSISVAYGRPFKNGRTIFGNLEKFGNVWRVGANQATTITFEKEVLFAGHSIPAGTYTLFVIPYETEWTLILNTKLGQWGTMAYEKFKSQNILEVNVPVTTLSMPVEQLTITFPTSSSMVIEWDTVKVTVPIT